MAGLLVRDRWLTPFQARQLLRGRHAGFFPTEKFKILDLLGEGGMGRVLLCEHLILRKLVAVKQLHPSESGSPASVDRFLREARAISRIDHPNLVRVLDVDTSSRTPMIVMDYVDGTNLHSLVVEHGKFSVPRVAEIVAQTAEALAAVHELGRVHRDIKPGNLMLDREGRVKIIDFGLARICEESEPLEDAWDDSFLLGTADFVSPEQSNPSNRDDVDHRTDIYSLGCTAFFLLTGRFPFEGGTVADKLARHRTQSAPRIEGFRADLPEEFAAVIQKMMRKRREDRFQTAAEVIAAIAPFRPGMSPPTSKEMPPILASEFRLGTSPRTGLKPAGKPQPLSSRSTPAPMEKLVLDSKVYQSLAAVPKTTPLPGRKPAAAAVPQPPTTPLPRKASVFSGSNVLLAAAAAAFFLTGAMAGALLMMTR